MTHASVTIAISRQRGSGGSYVGRLVADRLNLRYIDRELLRHAAEYLSTHQEAKPASAPVSWLERLGHTIGLGTADAGYTPPSSDVVYEGALFEIERRLMLEIAAEGNAVLVGRGAAQSLKGRSGVISVFLHAPAAWRAERVRAVYGMDSRSAEGIVRDSDRDRARFIRALCGNDWADVHGYDLAVDVATLEHETTAALIVQAAAVHAEMKG
jgi:cytidylate kinase